MDDVEKLKAEIAFLEADRDFWFEECQQSEPSAFMKWWLRCACVAALGWAFLAGAMMYPEPREAIAGPVFVLIFFLTVSLMIAGEVRLRYLRRSGHA